MTGGTIVQVDYAATNQGRTALNPGAFSCLIGIIN
jgi:hypothetical protein